MDDSKFVKEWEQIRQRGFWRFVLRFEPVRFLLMLAGYFGVGCLFSPLGWYTREVHYGDLLERSSQARE